MALELAWKSRPLAWKQQHFPEHPGSFCGVGFGVQGLECRIDRVRTESVEGLRFRNWNVGFRFQQVWP